MIFLKVNKYHILLNVAIFETFQWDFKTIWQILHEDILRYVRHIGLDFVVSLLYLSACNPGYPTLTPSGEHIYRFLHRRTRRGAAAPQFDQKH